MKIQGRNPKIHGGLAAGVASWLRALQGIADDDGAAFSAFVRLLQKRLQHTQPR